jgi:hypothetical protein
MHILMQRLDVYLYSLLLFASSPDTTIYTVKISFSVPYFDHLLMAI